jgi:hypothetical protein
MQPSYSFSVDVPRDLLRITMSGLFMIEDIARFCEARNGAVAHLTCPRGQHVTLVDIRGMKIQTQESVDQFKAVLADGYSAPRKPRPKPSCTGSAPADCIACTARGAPTASPPVIASP